MKFTDRAFTIVAGLFLLAAAVLLWRNNLTAAFVIATLGIVAWFLGFRAQTRAKVAADSAAQEDEDFEE